MTGLELHKKLKTIEIDGKKIILKNLAERLGMKEPAFQKRLKVGDVGIGFLFSICQALNTPISTFIDCGHTGIVAENSDTYGINGMQIKALKEEIAEAKQIIYELNLEILRLKTR